jgi:pyruvate,water dikinase
MSYCSIQEVNQEARYGGKAFQLGQIKRLGFPVPEGWALSVDFVEALVAGNDKALQDLEKLLQDFKGAFLAVRSSAIGEDSREASFAGQHSTLLNIRSYEVILHAIRSIWESARTPSAIAYRKKMGLILDPQMGVVLQKIVQASTSGILFNQNPITKKRERVIEAAWGLGEIVVQGLVIPDFYRLDSNGQILEKRPGIKYKAIRLSPSGGTYEEEVPLRDQTALCLSDAQLLKLHQLVSDCEEAFQEDTHDLEWAFENNHLYLLQRRTITTL